MSAHADPSPLTVAFGRRVRELRKERGWRQRDMAAIAGVAPSTLCKVEQGAGTTLTVAGKIAAALGKPLSEMLSPAKCGHCLDAPPHGFLCPECGTAGPGVTR